MKNMIDLHTHSTASDGSLSPKALIEEAAKRSITAIALTDHDSIGGLEEAAKAAAGQRIRFVPGIELEIQWDREKGGEFHLLGLNISQPSPGFLTAVEELSRRREERNLEIVDKMKKAGIAVTYDEIRKMVLRPESQGLKSRKHSIGRPHFADFLIKQKIVKNRELAFLRYLGRGKPFYVPKTGLEFDLAVKIIKDSGGVSVLAHPMSLYVAWGRLPELIKSLKDRGLDGLEAWHPTAKVSACRRLEELGKKLELCITAGSDFHGEARPGRKLGITAGGKKIDEGYLAFLPGKP